MADLPAQSPLPFVDGYLAYLLARASHLISGEFHREVEASGLSVQEWRVLATLADRPDCTIGTLAEITLTKQPTLTKLVDRMAADGLVTRRAGQTDRRQALISITPRGLAQARCWRAPPSTSAQCWTTLARARARCSRKPCGS
jgi:DNA-binding MarR family transcriptional regulator